MKLAILRKTIFLLSIYAITLVPVHASVVLKNTRVIFPGDKVDHTIQFSNNDEVPNIVQLWTDKGDEQSTPETADGPFSLLPPIFKVDAKSGQSVRMIYTGDSLPQDRESVFYLNFLVIPPSAKGEDGENRLKIILRNRVKVFYRPSSIDGSPRNSIDNMETKVVYGKNGEPESIKVKNNSGYYISMSSINVEKGETRYIYEPVMIDPYSSTVFENVVKSEKITDQNESTNDASLNMVYVNDFGAHVSKSIDINQ
jgi:P pilus assembly protein, chaperone PapD